MTTLLDKQHSATSNVHSRDEATLNQVLSRIAALAPIVAQCARDMEQDRRLPNWPRDWDDLRDKPPPIQQHPGSICRML